VIILYLDGCALSLQLGDRHFAKEQKLRIGVALLSPLRGGLSLLQKSRLNGKSGVLRRPLDGH
jgi:hypothetical protein